MTFDPQVAELQSAYWATAEQLLFHHTTPWELDEALVGAGFLIGPCEAQDLVGLDVVRERQEAAVTPVLSRMLAEGRMGKKGGVGYYRYPGRGGAVIDPLIEDLVREEAWFAKCERVELEPETLVAKLRAALAPSLDGLRRSGLAQRDVDAVVLAALHLPVSDTAVLV